jgi:hypothetical protein
MKHYETISKTDATAVVKVRQQELVVVMDRLSARLLADKPSFNWGDVGTISHLVEMLEDFDASFTK